MEQLERELVEYFNELKEKQISTMNHFRRIKRRLREKMAGRLHCECGRMVIAVRMEIHKKAITHIRSMNEKRAYS
jgi:hypothetical protein